MASTDNALPQGVQLTPLDEDYRENPYRVFRQLRERTPAHRDEVLGRYLITRHDDVRDFLHDRAFLTDPARANPGTFSREVLGAALRFGEKPSMLLMDEPDHRRLRMLVSGPFKPNNVERWRPHIRAIVEQALDAIAGSEFDLVANFAAPVPTIVIAEMLGIDPKQREAFKQWSDQSVLVSFNPFPTPAQKAQGETAIRALEDFFRQEIARRRKALGADLISDMLRAEIAGDKLTEEEIIDQCRLLLVAGNVTTTDLISNAVMALLDHPGQLEKLRAAPQLIQNAIEETLRYDSPVLNTGRIPNRDIDVGGCPVRRGESLSLVLGAANRDPSVYPDPDSFDIERQDTHHHAFGGGRHLCLGAHLARVEAQEAVLGLLNRYPTLSHSARGFVRHAIPTFRGCSEFWVTGG